jgi:hypothetical protein
MKANIEPFLSLQSLNQVTSNTCVFNSLFDIIKRARLVSAKYSLIDDLPEDQREDKREDLIHDIWDAISQEFSYRFNRIDYSDDPVNVLGNLDQTGNDLVRDILRSSKIIDVLIELGESPGIFKSDMEQMINNAIDRYKKHIGWSL